MIVSKELTRVLHVTEVLEAAGIESFIMNVYRNIDRNKIQFDFFVTRFENEFYDTEIKNLGGKKYTIDKRKTKNIFFKILKEAFYIYKFLSRHEYSIIHIHICTPLRIFYLFAAKMAKVKIRICHSHSSEVIGKSIFKRLVYYLIKQFFPMAATHFFACSGTASKWLYPKNIRIKGKDTIIYNGIDTEKFKYNETIRNQYRKDLNIEEKFVIGHIGRFTEQKNHKFFIKLLGEIRKKKDNVIVLFIGEGTLEGEIKNIVHKKGLKNNVIFLGVRSDINHLLQSMDYFIMPSLYEGLPVAAIEAQCSGLPCLFSENITDEISLVKNVQFLSLSSNIDKWVDKVIN